MGGLLLEGRQECEGWILRTNEQAEDPTPLVVVVHRLLIVYILHEDTTVLKMRISCCSNNTGEDHTIEILPFCRG